MTTGGGRGGGSRSWAGGAQSDAAPHTQVGERRRHHLHVSSGGGALNTTLTSCPLSAVYPPRPPPRIFGFVAKQAGGAGGNTCHLFAELDPEQPAGAIVSFITKVMLRAPPR